MDADDTMPISQEQVEPVRLRASDWLWRPWYAKLWWAAIPIYWIGRIVSIKSPLLAVAYDTLLANYMAIFFNPLIVLLLLGTGFVRKKLNRGEWVITSDVPALQQRQPGKILDPYTDPTDPRSGELYLRYIGVYDD